MIRTSYSRILMIALVAFKLQVVSGEIGGFLKSMAGADIVGLGMHGGHVGESDIRIDHAIFWLGDPGTNSVVITANRLENEFYWDPMGGG